jgi:hypothetical protein
VVTGIRFAGYTAVLSLVYFEELDVSKEEESELVCMVVNG